MFETAYTFDDVSLVPQYSDIASRRDVNLETFLTKNPNIKIKFPLIASPMKTVTGAKLAIAMANLGGVGVIHRFHAANEEESIKLQAEEIRQCEGLVGAAIGVQGNWEKRVDAALENGAAFIMVDIAHGNHKLQHDLIKVFKKKYSKIPIIAANVADYDGARRLCELGVNGIRSGLGSGSLCTTRIMTGCGVPSITSILMCRNAIDSENSEVALLYDGGIRYPGDVVKAIGAGADAVIIGSLFAGCMESAASLVYDDRNIPHKLYAGSASFENKGEHRYVEGTKKLIPLKWAIKHEVQHLVDGIQGGFSTCGARTVKEMQDKALFVKQTQNGVLEALPHLLNHQ